MKTVLIIEDNNDIRENTCEMLELRGYKVISANNGIVGLALAREIKPDIIFCDILMPESTGYEVFNGLKEDPSTASIPFIFLTASVEKSEVETGLGMGAKGYLSKPFEANELFAMIRKCLNTD
jgi:CheY-like chemotaxis protein